MTGFDETGAMGSKIQVEIYRSDFVVYATKIKIPISVQEDFASFALVPTGCFGSAAAVECNTR